MPELPEVEVVKKSLENKLKNLTIKKVNICNNKLRYKINNKKSHYRVEAFFFKYESIYLLSAKKRSASKAAIQPVPADVTA